MVPASLETVRRAQAHFLRRWDPLPPDYLWRVDQPDVPFNDEDEMLRSALAAETTSGLLFWHSHENDLMLGAEFVREGWMILSLSFDGFLDEGLDVLNSLKEFAGTSAGFVWGNYGPPQDAHRFAEAATQFDREVGGRLVELGRHRPE